MNKTDTALTIRAVSNGYIVTEVAMANGKELVTHVFDSTAAVQAFVGGYYAPVVPSFSRLIDIVGGGN